MLDYWNMCGEGTPAEDGFGGGVRQLFLYNHNLINRLRFHIIGTLTEIFRVVFV